MSKNVIDELNEFLKNVKLSNYEIKAYLALLHSNNMEANEISKKSRVPVGRIYEILDQLKEKGMIEIQESRPKIYRIIPPNQALNNLISHLTDESHRKIINLSDQAKILESKLQKSNFLVREDSSRIFWSTAFGWKKVFDLYLKKFSELEEELLLTGFIDKNTTKIIHFAEPFFRGIKSVLDRGIPVKYLWSFEYDQRPLPKELKSKNLHLYNELIEKIRQIFNFSQDPNLETRFIHNRIPTYFDIFDKKRIIIKLQDPMRPPRIYAAVNVLDQNLAIELRNKFYELWFFIANNKGPKM